MQHESLYIMIDNAEGKAQTFPLGKEPARLNQYTYTAQRMGDSAPQISGTLNYTECLKDEWEKYGKPYVMLDGEKYILHSIPTSKKSNSSLMFEHDVIFVAGRIILDREFFYDVVSDNTETRYKDRYRSNLAKFSFMGTIEEFVSRFNDALAYVGFCTVTQKGNGERVYDGYHLEIKKDEVPVDEIKEVSFDNTYLSKALQYINTEFGLAYYWRGKTCYVGLAEDIVDYTFEYGADGGLLSVNDTNSGDDIVTRITGTGSSDNIPYYYPNDNPDGTLRFITENFNKDWVGHIDTNILRKNKVNPYDCTLTLCEGLSATVNPNVNISQAAITPFNDTWTVYRDADDRTYTSQYGSLIVNFLVWGNDLSTIYIPPFEAVYQSQGDPVNILLYTDYTTYAPFSVEADHKGKHLLAQRCDKNGTPDPLHSLVDFSISNASDGSKFFQFAGEGWYRISLIQDFSYDMRTPPPGQDVAEADISVALMESCANVRWTPVVDRRVFLMTDDGVKIDNSKNDVVELAYMQNIPKAKFSARFNKDRWVLTTSEEQGVGRIIISGRDFVFPSQNLMPSIYRNTHGAERYYNAQNDTYEDENGEYCTFTHLYDSADPHAHVETFDDIKPTMRDIRNLPTEEYPEGQLFGEIADVAFDDDDDDSLTTRGGNTEDYVHSYFYIKLHKFDGDYGFNLFNQALESDTAKVDMISGNCAACSFEIGVLKKTAQDGMSFYFQNPVQVKKNERGEVVLNGGNWLSSQITETSEPDDANDENVIERKIDVNNIQDGSDDEDLNQQDTTLHEIWIALKKDNSTFGVIMPNATRNYRPQKGDRFVLTGIKMPKVYVLEAEERLDKALVKYMAEHNEDKFNFSLTLSRIWLKNHPEITSVINENAKLRVRYNGVERELYIKTFTLKKDTNILDEVTVELSEDIGIDESALDKRLKEIQKKMEKGVTQTIINNVSNSRANAETRAIGGGGSGTSSTDSNARPMTREEILEICQW